MIVPYINTLDIMTYLLRQISRDMNLHYPRTTSRRGSSPVPQKIEVVSRAEADLDASVEHMHCKNDDMA